MSGGRISFPPAIDHRGNIYFASDDRNLYSLLPSGREKWRLALPGKPTTAPVIGYSGALYIGADTGELIAVSPAGRELWRFLSLSGPCLSPALGQDGTIYLPTRGGTLHALGYFGKELWRYQLKAEISAPPSIGRDGTIYIPSGDRRLLALNPTGSIKWEIGLSGRAGTPAISTDGTIYVSTAGIEAISIDGSRLWYYAIPAATADPVVAPDGTIFVGAGNGKLYAIHPDGEKLWDVPLSRFSSAAAVTNSDIYIAGDNGSLYRVSREGELLQRFRAKKGAHAPVLSDRGLLYFGADDWILYAFADIEAEMGAWPLGLHDNQHTGRVNGLQDLDSPAALILKEMAFSDTRALKLRALLDIERHLEGASFLPVHVSVLEEVLGYLVAEGVTHRAYVLGRLVNDYPEIRLEACLLLGGLKTDGALAILVNVVQRDHDESVRIRAIAAIGEIGFDPYGDAVRVFSDALEHGAGVAFTLAAIDAVQSIIEGNRLQTSLRQGSRPEAGLLATGLRAAAPGDLQAYRFLVLAARVKNSKKVRQTAMTVLKNLTTKRRSIP